MGRPFLATCFFLGVLVIVLGLRVPFFTDILVGEEGSFASLVADPVKPSDSSETRLPQDLIATVDGERFYAAFEHNVVPYLLIERGPGTITRDMNILSLPPLARTAAIRAAFFAMFVTGFVAILAWTSWVASASSSPLFGLAILTFGLTTPLVVGASIQPQIDGSVGVMLLGLASLLLVSSGSNEKLGKIYFSVAGVLVGLGRMEWPLAFASIAIAVLILCLMLNSRSWRQCCALIVGITLGVAIAVLISPGDYRQGLGLMGRIYAAPNDRVSVVWHMVNFLWPLLALLILVFFLILARLKTWLDINPGVVITGGSGAAIALGFAISGWPGDGFPRYYAPAIVLSSFAAAILITRSPKPANRRIAIVFIAFACLGVGVNVAELARAKIAAVSITSDPGISLLSVKNEMASIAEKVASRKAIAFTHAGIWVYDSDVNYISRDMGWDGAKVYLGKKHAGLKERL